MPPFETVNCSCAPDPCQQGQQGTRQSSQNWLSDNLLMSLLALAVVLFCFYFVIRSGVKNGILDVANDPNFSLSKILGGQDCR